MPRERVTYDGVFIVELEPESSTSHVPAGTIEHRADKVLVEVYGHVRETDDGFWFEDSRRNGFTWPTRQIRRILDDIGDVLWDPSSTDRAD